jgi:hypothetical protein
MVRNEQRLRQELVCVLHRIPREQGAERGDPRDGIAARQASRKQPDTAEEQPREHELCRDDGFEVSWTDGLRARGRGRAFQRVTEFIVDKKESRDPGGIERRMDAGRLRRIFRQIRGKSEDTVVVQVDGVSDVSDCIRARIFRLHEAEANDQRDDNENGKCENGFLVPAPGRASIFAGIHQLHVPPVSRVVIATLRQGECDGQARDGRCEDMLAE